MIYSKKVLAHFKKPHNQGAINNPSVIGEAGNPICGDVMKIYLKIDKEKIKDVKFETLGCAAAIAVSSALTDRVKGMTINDALKLTKDDIVKDLCGLPEVKIHCSMLGIDALKKALNKYKKNN